MIIFPNAKINIGLNIIEKRTDGFHNIESVFYPIGLCDALEVVPNESKGNKNLEVEINSSGIEIPGTSDSNLCVKAYHLIKKDYDLPPVKIHLHKAIPIGAGLGGGSSDGAFFINLLNSLFELNLAWGEKHHYAKQLGSDCSFFITNKPAFAAGKGEILEPLNINLKGYLIALIYPQIHISTPEAYSLITPGKPEVSLEEIVENTPVEDWKNHVLNDFEKPLFAKYPALKNIKEELYKQGAVYASMSGSGSSVYGIFKEQTDLKKVFKDYVVWEGKL